MIGGALRSLLTKVPEKAHEPLAATKPEMLVVDGRILPITLRTSTTAHRLTLRLDSRTGGLMVVHPKRCSKRDALAFAREQGEWIKRHLAALPPAIPFVEGSVIPYLGQPLTITSQPTARRGVWIEGELLCVSGFPEHLPRRVAAWLKAQAKREIEPRARALAEQVGKPVGRITLRDTRSRWGSCSAAGDLNFSWRLVFTPEVVLDYVIAHEIAHLVEMNHSPRFWAVVASLGHEPVAARHWLKKHGAQLFYYGKTSNLPPHE